MAASTNDQDHPRPRSSRSTPSDLRTKLSLARNNVVATLKTTDWPNDMAEVEGLLRAVETPLQLERLPRDESRFLPESKAAIERHIEDFTMVHALLRKESAKYGTKGKGTSRWFRSLGTKTDLIECATTLRACQFIIEKSTATLNDHLRTLEANNDSRTSADKTESPPETDQPSGTTDQDRKRRQRWNAVISGTHMTLQVAEGLSKLIPVVGPFVEATASAGIKIVEMVQVMSGNIEVSENLKEDVCRLYDILDKFTNPGGEPEVRIMEKAVEELQKELLNVRGQISEMQCQADLTKLLRSSEHAESLKGIQEKLRIALEELQLLVSLNTSNLIAEHNKETERRRLLDSLGDGKYGARGNRIEDAICLEGTRVEILERITAWIRDEETSKRVLWISGTAGRGKSAILSTVAHNWQRRASCAIFHFRRDQSARDDHLVCALARQLGKSLDPDLRSAILSTVAKTDDIASKRLDEQFETLFTTPFSTLKAKPSRILMFIDALDECESVDYAVEFIKLIKLHSASLPGNVKFILTSRPEPRLQSAIKGLDHMQEESLDEIAGVDADIERFINHAFEQIRLEHKLELKSNWPSPNPAPKLVSMSQGLFQWARTAMKFIGDKSPTTRLEEILTKSQQWSGVDDLYHQILSTALGQVPANSERRDLLLASLGTIVVAPYPISLDELAFVHSHHELTRNHSHESTCALLRNDVLSDISSLLSFPKSSSEPLRLMHTSIRDLLTDAKRCENRPYSINLEKIHRQLAVSCITLMNQYLKENICRLPDFTKPSAKLQDVVNTSLPSGIRYCCSCWTIHITESGEWSASATGFIDGEFTLFTEGKILFWLEVMSLIERADEAVNMASQICTWLSTFPHRTSLIALWRDAHRFVTAFLEPISYGPLHIYSSALGQCPVKTALWERYGKHAKIRVLRGSHKSTWSSTLWTHDASSSVPVAFSPDGALLAYSSGGVSVRDTKTGRSAGGLFGRSPHYLSFSSNGDSLAVHHDDVQATLLDCRTGCVVGDTIWLEGEYRGSTAKSWRYRSESVDPLSNGSLLVCRRKNDVRIMDTLSQSQVGSSLEYHYDSVQILSCSPSGKLVALGWGPIIRLFDPYSWKELSEPLAGHSESLECLRFSPDGTLLASGSRDFTIRLWNLQTFKQVGEALKGHSNTVHSLCFSHCGERVASASKDSIRIWDTRTRVQLGEPLTGNNLPGGICFSSDGQLLSARNAEKGTIELSYPQLITQTQEQETMLEDEVKSLCFSPDNALLATGHRNSTIRLWNLRTGAQDDELTLGEQEEIISVAFSPVGRLLVSGSDRGTIRLWDLQTREQLGESPIAGYHKNRYAGFSPDGKWIFGCDTKNAEVWDTRQLKKCSPDTLGSFPDCPTLTLSSHWVETPSSSLLWLPPQYWTNKGWPPPQVFLSHGKLVLRHGSDFAIFDVSGVIDQYLDTV